MMRRRFGARTSDACTRHGRCVVQVSLSNVKFYPTMNDRHLLREDENGGVRVQFSAPPKGYTGESTSPATWIRSIVCACVCECAVLRQDRCNPGHND